MLFWLFFFFQLQDDIIAKKMYFKKITDFVRNITSNDWFYIEFSILGFIGKQLIYTVVKLFNTVILQVLKSLSKSLLLNGKK